MVFRGCYWIYHFCWLIIFCYTWKRFMKEQYTNLFFIFSNNNGNFFHDVCNRCKPHALLFFGKNINKIVVEMLWVVSKCIWIIVVQTLNVNYDHHKLLVIALVFLLNYIFFCLKTVDTWGFVTSKIFRYVWNWTLKYRQHKKCEKIF